MHDDSVVVDKLVDVLPELIDRSAKTLGELVDKRGRVPSRQVFSCSVDTWLPVVVATLQAVGLIHRAAGRRRPRRFDHRTWVLLDKAEKHADVARVALLRATLELQARYGSDVKGFLGDLSKLVPTSEKKLREILNRDKESRGK